jgi:hypothetical protein
MLQAYHLHCSSILLTPGVRKKTDAVLCGPQENVLGQKFAVDVTIWADLTASCKSDDLSDTLDYRDTYR